MTPRKMRRPLYVATTGLALTALLLPLTMPATAQMIVYDPTNFSQNVLTAARELQQVQNQVTALANQAQMLTNQAKNLAQLPTTTLAQVQAQAQATQSLLTSVQKLAFNVQQIETAFSGTYGTVPAGATTATLSTNALTRWQTSIAAFQDSLKIGAGVVGNVSTTNTSRSTLVTASQSATGSLQALQAGNQLLALQSQQLSDLVSMLAAKARSDALEQARAATAEASGQQQYTLFSARSGYVPGNVTMFSGN